MSKKNVWAVDDIPDANGHWTIRPTADDGSIDLEAHPIATVYEREDADFIAAIPIVKIVHGS